MRAGLWDLTKKMEALEGNTPNGKERGPCREEGACDVDVGSGGDKECDEKQEECIAVGCAGKRSGGEPNPKPSRSVATGSSNMTR